MTKQFYLKDIHVFAKTMGISHLSTDKIVKLAEMGVLKSPADLYTLNKQQLVDSGISMRNANVVLYLIRQSKTNRMAVVLAALNIKGFGTRKTESVALAYPSLDRLYNLKDVSTLCGCAFIASGTAKNIIDYFNDPDNVAMLKQLEKHGVGL